MLSHHLIGSLTGLCIIIILNVKLKNQKHLKKNSKITSISIRILKIYIYIAMIILFVYNFFTSTTFIKYFV